MSEGGGPNIVSCSSCETQRIASCHKRLDGVAGVCWHAASDEGAGVGGRAPSPERALPSWCKRVAHPKSGHTLQVACLSSVRALVRTWPPPGREPLAQPRSSMSTVPLSRASLETACMSAHLRASTTQCGSSPPANTDAICAISCARAGTSAGMPAKDADGVVFEALVCARTNGAAGRCAVGGLVDDATSASRRSPWLSGGGVLLAQSSATTSSFDLRLHALPFFFVLPLARPIFFLACFCFASATNERVSDCLVELARARQSHGGCDAGARIDGADETAARLRPRSVARAIAQKLACAADDRVAVTFAKERAAGHRPEALVARARSASGRRAGDVVSGVCARRRNDGGAPTSLRCCALFNPGRRARTVRCL